MPIYEYACRACAHQFELLVLKTTVPACPKCDGTDLERVMSLPAVQGDGTRERSLRAAKQRDARQGAERNHAQREYERNHD